MTLEGKEQLLVRVREACKFIPQAHTRAAENHTALVGFICILNRELKLVKGTEDSEREVAILRKKIEVLKQLAHHLSEIDRVAIAAQQWMLTDEVRELRLHL